MDMQGQRQLSATQEQAWAALNDPEMLKSCIPGCEKFELDGDNTYSVTTAIKIGPVAARFSGKVQLTDIEAPVSYKLNFEAQGGVAGFGKGESSVALKPTDGGCELSYTVHSTVGGKIAQLGQRLIDGVAKNLSEDFFKRFEAELEKRHPAPPTGDDPNADAQGAQPTQSAASSSSPPSAPAIPIWVWGAGAVAVALAMWVAEN